MAKASRIDETAARRRAVTRVLVLGANLWWLTALWPVVSTTTFEPEDSVWLAAMPLLLLGGARALAHSPALGSAIWLIGVPLCAAGAVASRPPALLGTLYGLLPTCLLLASVPAYAAAAVAACSERRRDLPARHLPLAAPAFIDTSDGRILRRTVFSIGLLGSVVLGLIAPLWGGPELIERAWGEASAEGAVLTAVAAGALAVSALGFFVGNAMRPLRAPMPSQADQPLKLASYLLLTILSLVTYYILS